MLCVTRGYGDHPPLTSDAALEEEMISFLEFTFLMMMTFLIDGRTDDDDDVKAKAEA